MKARKNPTPEQLAKRMWRNYPDSNPGLPAEKLPARAKNDSYWALRAQGYSDAYAKRVFRDQPPVIRQRTACTDLGEYACDPEDLLLPPGSTWTEIEVEIRPELSENTIPTLKPRASEYTVWDTQVRRFGVRVRPSGHTTYIVNYHVRYQKKLHKLTIGPITEFTLEQARSIARDIRRAARMGNNPVCRP